MRSDTQPLSETVLEEQLLDVLKIPKEKQTWFKDLVLSKLDTEPLKQEFVKRFSEFLTKDGRRQDALVEAVTKRKKYLMKAMLRHFVGELEKLNDPLHAEVLKPIADAFNSRQKFPMPGRE